MQGIPTCTDARRQGILITATDAVHMGNGDETIVIEITRQNTETKPARPAKYKVLLHNDDYTPMDFVVELLCRLFQKTVEEATELMLEVHHTGAAICGVFTFEVAETKVQQVLEYGSRHDHPIQCTMEKA